MQKAKRRDPDVVSITTAPETPGEELARRQKRYLMSMGLRTICFVGAIVVGQGVLRYVLIGGALVLPYIAVVMANAVAVRLPGSAQAPQPQRRQLPPRDGGA